MSLRPGAFCQQLLAAPEVSEGRRKRPKRNPKPEAIKRAILQQAVQDDPAADQFESWLLEQIFRAPARGPVRALCSEILAVYRDACAETIAREPTT
jgi:hypothetical protein